MIGYIFAGLSGAVHGLMNVADKYVVSHKVKKPFGYAVFVGLFNLLLGIVVSLFLDWSTVTRSDLLMPVIAGFLYGTGCYVYYSIMSKEDASHAIGLTYLYPLIVAIFSFLFLSEKLSLIQYIGVAITIIGATLLSVRLNELKLKTTIFALSFFILSIAFLEIAVKVASDTISPWNGSAITFIAFGATVLFGLFSKRVREDAKSEWRNAKLTSITESLNFTGNLFLYFAMTSLPATVVSSICATQPVFVLLFEKLAHKKFGSMARDEEFGKKLISITFIVLGIVLLYAFQ